MIVGSGTYRYRINADWAKLPDGWSFKEVGGVGVERRDNVYVFNRGEHPMMVFDHTGNFLRSWGEGQYPRAHGVHIAPDDTMFLTDDGGHFVRNAVLPHLAEQVVQFAERPDGKRAGRLQKHLENPTPVAPLERVSPP